MAAGASAAWQVATAGSSTPPLTANRVCRWSGQRPVDAIVFGDEPAGILTALELARQWHRQ
ncbi:MAG: hypothetical protein VKI42_00565 [Synechococcaceae cyanobacterium]|nr:hypothetical protein [Synechococcaceae cyanobacterium]